MSKLSGNQQYQHALLLNKLGLQCRLN